MVYREPPALSQQLYVNHLARPLTCIARRDLATGHIMNFEGAVETKLDYRKKETLMQTDRALEAAVNVESREEFDSVRPFVEPEVRIPCMHWYGHDICRDDGRSMGSASLHCVSPRCRREYFACVLQCCCCYMYEHHLT